MVSMGGQEISANDAERRLSDLLIECRLNSFVTTRKIRHWLEEGCFGDEPIKDALAFLPMVTGLVDPETQDRPRLLERLVNALLEFYDTVPQKALDGKTPREKSDEVLDGPEPESLRLGMMTLPPHDWIPFYERAMTELHRKKLSDAAKSFDELFVALLGARTTARDVYRIFANAGLAYVCRGDSVLASRCWKAALDLNPKYGYPRDQLDKLERGDFNEIIAIGMLGRAKENLERKRSQPDATPERVNKMSEEALLKKLRSLGLEIDRARFVEHAGTAPSPCELADALLYPQFKGVYPADPDDDDFVWMAAGRLWALWCPEEPSEETLWDLIEEAYPKCVRERPEPGDPDSGPTPVLADLLRRLTDILMADKPGFLEHWSKTYEYHTEMRDTLVDILCIAVRWQELEAPVLKVASNLRERVPRGGWELVEIASLVRKKDPAWKAVYTKMCDAEPFNCHLPLNTAHLLEDDDDYEAADDRLMDALNTVDLRARKEVWDLDTMYTTIYEDYKDVLDALEASLMDSSGQPELEAQVEKKRMDVEASREVLSFSPRREALQKHASESLRKLEEEQASSSPAMRYLDYLGKFDINFRTPGPVETTLTPVPFRGRTAAASKRKGKAKKAPSPGRAPPRKGPCPCGSGKMYKNCCGQRR